MKVMTKLKPIQSTYFALIFFVLITCYKPLGGNANEIPVRYDGAQLWRIPYNSETAKTPAQILLPKIMEKNFSANIWNDDSVYLDISIDKHFLTAAKLFLKQHNIQPEILNTNIQNLFDEEMKTDSNIQNLFDEEMKTDSNMNQFERTFFKAAIKATKTMSWTAYHSLSTIYNYMNVTCSNLSHICTLMKIGTTEEGRDLLVVRISENPMVNKKIWVDGGIHAREWVSPATVTYIMDQLLSNWTNQPNYLRNKTWYFMPMINPDGYEYSRTVNRLWRKNRAINKQSKCKGVDLNRNFPIGWNTLDSSAKPCAFVYRGLAPVSELETQAIVKFLQQQEQLNLDAFLSFHSYGQEIIYPWNYKSGMVKNEPLLRQIAIKAAQSIRKTTRSLYRVVNGITMHPAGGSSGDWAYENLNVTFVYTIELGEAGKYQFFLPTAKIQSTAREGLILVDAVAQSIL